MDKDRPFFFGKIIECFKKFNKKFMEWVIIENEKRKIAFTKKQKRNNFRGNFTPYDKNFLNNPKLLNSKFIYNLFLNEYAIKKNFQPKIEMKEQESIYSLVHKKISFSNIRLVNYKLLHNGLPTNFKFNNRYENHCFMCKKKLNEDLEHIFVKCSFSKKIFDYIKINWLRKENLRNSLDLLKFKRNLSEEHYRIISCYIYCTWRIRNECKHKENYKNILETFKVIFNKWIISMNSI